MEGARGLGRGAPAGDAVVTREPLAWAWWTWCGPDYRTGRLLTDGGGFRVFFGVDVLEEPSREGKVLKFNSSSSARMPT